MNMSANKLRLASAVVFLVASAALSGCGDSTASPSPQILRFSVIPDWNKGKLAADSLSLAKLLSEKLGVEVRYEQTNSYLACVNALAANKIDFAWLGGKTTCDAIDECKGAAHVIATRDIDLKFKSYFIGNRDAVAAGKLVVVDDLAKWQGKTASVRFTFGSRGSTSGHLMPRYFLSQAGIDPEQSFQSVGYAEGSHAGTLQSVASGAVDCGALNYAYYDAASAEEKAKAPILFTTSDYVDYAWVAHDRIGEERLQTLQAVLLGLNRKESSHASILDAWSAGRFVAAKDDMWDSIRQVRDALPKDFLTK